MDYQKPRHPYAVVVNSNNIMALTVIRSLGKQGIPIIAIFGESRFFGQYAPMIRCSKFISTAFYFEENDYEKNLVSQLLKIGRSLDKKAVLFPVDDEDMIVVSANRIILEEFYHILMPPHSMLKTLLYKELFYEFSNENNLPIPKTFIVEKTQALEGIANKINFPCIIKPPLRNYKWRKIYKNRKVLIANERRELSRLLGEVIGLFQKVVVQEIIVGSESNIICSFTFLDINSEPIGMFVCRKIRQFPPHFGNTASAESIIDEKAVTLTKSICKQLSLVGYVSIEFKKDSDNAYRIFEITPCRLNRQAGLANASGVNLAYIWYCYLIGHSITIQNDYTLSTKWLSEVNEVRSILYYLKKREHTLYQLLQYYKRINQFELLDRDDLVPSLMLLPSLLHFMRSKLKTHTRRSGEL